MLDDRPLTDQVIDRERERDVFRTVLASADRPRVISICDRPGMGKSWLLRRLEADVEDVDGRAVTATVEIEPDADAMSLAEEISNALAASNAPLARFQELNLARMALDHERFGLRAPPSPTMVNVDVKVAQSQLDHSPTTVSTAPNGWPSGHERAAAQQCLSALLDDLKELSRTRPVVLLVDRYQIRGKEVGSWLDVALATKVFDETDPFGALVLVVATEAPPFPKLPKALGARASSCLYELSPLSRWRDDHLRQYMEQLGLGPAWTPGFRQLLDSDKSLLDLRLAAAAILTTVGSA